MKKAFIIALIVIVLGFITRFILLGMKSRDMQVDLGLKEGRLLPCTLKSHCFETSDLKEDEIPNLLKSPLALERIKAQALEQGLVLQTEQENYLHFTHSSTRFGFVDDIEFHYHPEDNRLTFRSSSRVGKSDLGANKKRILKLFHGLTP